MCDKCTSVCSCVKLLQLGVGKIFLDRNNNKIKIVAQEQNPNYAYYKWLGVHTTAGSLSWFRDDGGFSTVGSTHNNDLVKEYREPAIIYANEYSDGYTGSAYSSKEEAIRSAPTRAIRKGVKFVEVIEDGTNNA